ncbi:MAG: hypothetical protein DWQ05_15885 [Calditrichaeota bacterium]|nr:MAG: hypothetical protein DWQ05_15885 [Calditrichota bacterium]
MSSTQTFLRSLLHKTISTLSFIVIIFISNIYAQNKQVKFERITIDEGLSDNRILSITKDRFGYMWFGTENGLNCYDGYEIKFWRWQKNDSTAILNSRIADILADSSGTLWVSSETGLSRLDFANRQIGRFQNYYHEFLGNLFETGNQTIWTHDKTNILKFDKESQVFTPVVNGSTQADSNLRWLFMDQAGVFWLTTTKSLYRFAPDSATDIKNLRFERFQLPEKMRAKYSFFEEITSPLADPNKLWLQTHITWPPARSSWLQFDKAKKYFSNLKENSLLSSDGQHQYIAALWQDYNGDLWMGSYRNGLYFFPADGGESHRYKNSISNKYSLSSNKISCIYRDRDGILWIGTNGGGVNKLKPPELSFEMHRNLPADSVSHKYDEIWSFFEDSHGMLWIGTKSSLVQMSVDNLGKTRFIPVLDFNNQKAEMHGSQIRAIAEERPGVLWLALTNPWQDKLDRLLARFDVEKREVTFPLQYPHTGSIYCMHIDEYRQIWLGTNGTGLVKIDSNRRDIRQYLFNTRGATKGNHWVTTMLAATEEGQNIFWLGTYHHGLVKFDPVEETSVYFQNDPDDPASIPTNGILSLSESTDGSLWIGTRGFGLVRMDEQENGRARFTQFSVKDGLPDNVIYGILQDESGIIWLSTDRGLSRFNPRSMKFKNYNTDDGLQSNEFNLGAFFKDSRGSLFFGGNHGFNSFVPSDFTDYRPPQVMLTKFRKFGRVVELEKPLHELKEIRLNSRENFFGFEFVALHFKDPKRNEYAYKLEGFDKDWVHIGNKRQANYTNLDPGEYTFRVKAANRDCIWNEKGASIEVRILPSFWQTPLFFILTIVLFTSILYGLHWTRLRINVRRAVSFAEEKERIQKKIMQDFHDEFGGRISNISRLSKIASSGLESNKLDRAKTLQKIAKNADRLYKEQRELLWELNPENNSLSELIDQLKSYSEELFDSTNIAFQLTGNFDAWMAVQLTSEWRQHLFRIFKEGMHNIFKHARNCENVVLDIRCKDAHLEIKLEDDGPGFNAATGSKGNGLKSMASRAAEIGAIFEILQNDNMGTTIFVRGKLS